jgi:hypothetical protein
MRFLKMYLGTYVTWASKLLKWEKLKHDNAQKCHFLSFVKTSQKI